MSILRGYIWKISASVAHPVDSKTKVVKVICIHLTQVRRIGLLSEGLGGSTNKKMWCSSQCPPAQNSHTLYHPPGCRRCQEPLVASLLLVVWPGAPSSFLLLVAMPGAPSIIIRLGVEACKLLGAIFAAAPACGKQTLLGSVSPGSPSKRHPYSTQNCTRLATKCT